LESSDTDIHLLSLDLQTGDGLTLRLLGSPLVHIHNNFVALCFADMKFTCIYYHNQLLAASDYDKEQII